MMEILEIGYGDGRMKNGEPSNVDAKRDENMRYGPTENEAKLLTFFDSYSRRDKRRVRVGEWRGKLKNLVKPNKF